MKASLHDKTKKETVSHLLEGMIKYMKSQGLRITGQRRLILEAVASQVGWHVHPKSVFAYVHERDKDIGLVTVYRTLKMLEDMDLLNQVYSMGMRFHSGHSLNHYHLICVKCGTIQDVSDTLPIEIKCQIHKDYDFEMTDINLSVYGICNKCKTNK